MPKNTPVLVSTKCKVKECAALNPDSSHRWIAKQFGLHHKTVDRILREGSSGKTYADLVGNAQSESAETSGTLLTELVLDEPEGNWVQNDKYVYNGDSDTYITFLKCRPKPLVVNGNKFRSMKKAYSDWDGKPATINEICRRFAIPRDQFMGLTSF